ncbi:MAG: hypothetical protein NC098_05980 [Lachnoclostridium sp.]|nr:hypothetical protein [Lachnoclostridium sp.]
MDKIDEIICKNEYLNSYNGKESTEWSNFWYDQANTESEHRILLIGDSVSRQIRGTMARKLNCPVDLFATSAALRDIMFWEQFKCFFKNGLYHYDAVFIWIGNHSRRKEDGTDFFTQYDYQRFHNDFSKLVDICRASFPKVIILSTLHMFIPRKANRYIEYIREILNIKPKEKFDDAENAVVEAKNKIIEQVANEYNLTFYDIDDIMLKSKYWHKDNIHYIRKSDSFVTSKLISLL